MHTTTTTEINAILNQAKQQRAEHIGAAFQWSVLPVAFAALLSVGVALTVGSSPDHAHQSPVVDTTVHHG